MPRRAVHWLLACIAGLYLSALSSFQMGWQEHNVRMWMMTRLQPREYNIRATGWVRTVSGIQSPMNVSACGLDVFWPAARVSGIRVYCLLISSRTAAY
jgi:hypothetical protein